MIYVIRPEGSTVIKVGESNNPTSRKGDLQVASPVELELVCVFPGDKAVEKFLHRELADRHVRGEWFEMGADDPEEVIGDLLREVAIPKFTKGPVTIDDMHYFRSVKNFLSFSVGDFRPMSWKELEEMDAQQEEEEDDCRCPSGSP